MTKDAVVRLIASMRDHLLLAMQALERGDFDAAEKHIAGAATELERTLRELRS